MTNEIWINLPVKDIKKSKEFFTKIGFTFNDKVGNNETMASMLIGKNNFVVMLFSEPVFMSFINHHIADTARGTEVLISIDAESREEVDRFAENVEKAGGTLYGKPGESLGWMYGFGFIDLDGHRWNVLYMDVAKMPK